MGRWGGASASAFVSGDNTKAARPPHPPTPAARVPPSPRWGEGIPTLPLHSIMTLPLAFRLARREMRGGLRGFGIFLACLALGVAAIAGVGSLSAAVDAGLKGDARVVLGGDVEFHLINRAASDAQLAALRQGGE